MKYVETRKNQAPKWGYQIEDGDQKYEWFKLDLDPNNGMARERSDLAEKYPSTTALPTGLDVSTEKLVIDYLTALRKHVEYVLGQKLSNAVIRNIPIKYIITVPAVWSPMAQAKTRSCAESAGMGRGDSLYIISEPEAAAMYALETMNPHDLEIGDTFVVCDAGGGYDIRYLSVCQVTCPVFHSDIQQNCRFGFLYSVKAETYSATPRSRYWVRRLMWEHLPQPYLRQIHERPIPR